MRLKSYACGAWIEGEGKGVVLKSAITGEPVAEISSKGIDYAAMLKYGREVGGPALRALSFHQRAIKLKELGLYLQERKEEFYELSKATGATRSDSWIDIEGGTGTLFAYSSKGRRELPNGQIYIDGNPEILSRKGTFVGQHVYLPLEGVAIHINAFNFPCWGMLEKLAPTFIAGVPSIIKPASQTAYLTELMVQRIIESGILPEGSLQLISGSVGDLLDHVTCQDAVTFTGSASTGLMLRQHPAIINNSVRFTMEADSLNSSILGLDAEPGTEEFDLYIKEVVREMTVKCGQKCTAIRRAIVPRHLAHAVIDALKVRLDRVIVGNPDDEGVTMGALASSDQCAEVRDRVGELTNSCDIVYGDPASSASDGGAFLKPILLYCDQPLTSPEVHKIEAFGPVSTVVPYGDVAEAVQISRMGQGSLVSSIFTYDDEFAKAMVMGLGAWHGRLLIANRDCAKESTGHGSPLPYLIHGGPGRAGGGQEMGGIRGVLHYMQCVALQGSPSTLSAVTDKWIPGARRIEDTVHPFRKTIEELRIGEGIISDTRVITLDDIEHFAEFSGDKFYAHMDEEAAKANPFFEGRVAHGYFIVSAAAGLFVDPAPGPVLANYGLENLRFLTPLNPGDSIQVTFTCKQKVPRVNEEYGEVRWDCQVKNQHGDLVATYDVLTLVAKKSAV
ncbi:phenylacetic acid degradation bifunctional protein PaaZ [Sedimenticola selenatireducens]|uniref:Phenylacetic acid degradation bifunctional protein PaaZ n=1 Tax=Sedimenticola selenatireducens TaxID=191960 RepID=A0A557RYI2_9GAMM|nr:phenylacetic acid degradation bifunctional protein PaaZ [Sedimenticola selenatireducens]TVO70230.1 phenylacetic acid degradation bifunctional protein PaaZ [Sedimenticola selenatireducens]TVT61133.1 MAG: phenylacetic acid degradation bifunctional protein PaaZ [Sedimenticola selenatireducens]